METDSRLSMADQSVAIKDTVTYKNLIPGESYTIRGILMDQDAGEKIMIEEKPVEAVTTFIPENASGGADVVFQFDGSLLGGKSAVVFERLYLNDCCIASHEDLGDELQTIHFPKIRTEAADGEQGGHQSEADEMVKIVDTVTYENLIPNKKYTVRGVLMDRETNKTALQDERAIISEVGFRAEESSGQAEVTFRFDGTDFGGKDIVAFEKLYQDGKCIAAHEDIDDEKQKISFVSINTGTPKTKETLRSNPPKTGDQVMLTLWILLAVLAGNMLTAVRKKE